MSEVITAGLVYLCADLAYCLPHIVRVEINNHKKPETLKASQKLDYELNDWKKMKPIGPFSWLFKGSRIESANEYKEMHKELEKIEFGPAILECEKRKLLSAEELAFLRNKKDKIRNPYLHYNQMKITEGGAVIGWEIKDPVPKLLELDERVKRGEITEEQARKELIKGIEPKLIDAKAFRPVAQIIKGSEDKAKAFIIFKEIDKFVREFALKYFKTD